MELTVTDRDALAVAMTRHNAELNGIKADHMLVALMDNLPVAPVDLLVSNIPAKAGEPVHRAFLDALPRLLNSGGTAALVIVTPLVESFRAMTAATGLTVTYEEKTANHFVLHLKPGKEQPAAKQYDSPLGASFRSACQCRLADGEYTMETVFSLPEFDTPSYGSQAAAGLIARQPPEGSILALNPGQGHLAARIAVYRPEKITLAGRDLLQLTAAARNISLNNGELTVETACTPWPAEFPDFREIFTWIVTGYAPVPETPASTGFQFLADALAPRGRLLVFGKSADMHQLLKKLPFFELKVSSKYRGFRAAILQKK